MIGTVLVLAIVGLGISRIAHVLNEFFSPVIPAHLGKMAISGQRVVLWIVGAAFGVVAVQAVGYDPIAQLGIAEDADAVWNVLFIVTIADAAHAFFTYRLLRH